MVGTFGHEEEYGSVSAFAPRQAQRVTWHGGGGGGGAHLWGEKVKLWEGEKQEGKGCALEV